MYSFLKITYHRFKGNFDLVCFTSVFQRQGKLNNSDELHF